MEKNSLINEAHLLQRKSEENARRGLFDDAIQNCIAASDCLSRLLTHDVRSESSSSYFISNDQVKDSIRTQLEQLERRKKSIVKKKRQFEYLKNLLAQQQRLGQQKTETFEAEDEKPRRGSSASSLRRRSSVKDNRRRGGVVETPSEALSTPRNESNQQKTRLASILDASPDSYSLLTTYLDGRANDSEYDVGSAQSSHDSKALLSGKVACPEAMEALLLQNAQLQQHVSTLLQKVEKERSKSAALEASLYELSLYPKRLAIAKDERLSFGVNAGNSSTGVDEDEVTVEHPAELFRLNRLPLDLPPLDPPPIDIPPLELYDLPP